MKTINTKEYMTELVGNLIEEFVNMHELTGADLSYHGNEKLVIATELLTQAMDELIRFNK